MRRPRNRAYRPQQCVPADGDPESGRQPRTRPGSADTVQMGQQHPHTLEITRPSPAQVVHTDDTPSTFTISMSAVITARETQRDSLPRLPDPRPNPSNSVFASPML
nr:hypothetical protein GCM10017611_68410 [Rhodococcus wratislaviensis]